jgi:hypothetical protein
VTRYTLPVLAGLLVVPAARADDYYVTVFSAQSVPYKPTKTHTFVAAVRVPSCANGYCPPAEMTSISWLPATLKIRALALRSERGVNLSVPDTLAWVNSKGMRISVWGPYQVHPDLYHVIQNQAALLNSGLIRYKPTDTLYSSHNVANCYHAIWAPIDQTWKWAGAFTAGDAASGKTVELFSPWIVNPPATYPHMLPPEAVGYPIVSRSYYDRPTRRAAIRSFLRD